MLTNIAPPMTLSSCDMATRRLAGAFPSMIGSFTTKTCSRYGAGCKQLDRLLGVRTVANAARSDIPVNRSSDSGAGAGSNSSGGASGDTDLQQRQDDRSVARRGGRGRRGGSDVVPFGGLGGGLIGETLTCMPRTNQLYREFSRFLDF